MPMFVASVLSLACQLGPTPGIDEPPVQTEDVAALMKRDPGSKEPADPSAEPVDAPPPTARKREWMLVVAPGVDYIRGPQNAYTALGGGFRLGGHAVSWIGKKGHVLIGGGPILHYSYIADRIAQDVIHLVTVNGDFLVGGGNQRFGVYWHLTTGFGYLSAVDGATGTKIGTLGVRAGTGLGGFAKIGDRFSLGALVDFGWAGGLWVNPMLTANIHFGRRGDPL